MSNRFAFAFLAAASMLAACSDSSTEPVAVRAAARAFVYQGNDQRVAAGKVATDSLAVLLVDANGAPVADVEVTWSSDQAGVLSQLSTRTDAQGIAKVAYTAGTRVAIGDVQASPAGLDPVHFALQVAPDAPARIEAMAQLVDTIAFDEALTAASVRATDQYGNPIAELQFAVALVDTEGGAADLGTVTTDAQGVAAIAAPVTAAAGDYQLRFTSGELAIAYHITVLPEPVVEGRGSSLRRTRP